MDAEGLLAPAAINLGLALVALSLFSLLKKQPGNAPVYLARRMAAGHRGGSAGGGGGGLPLGHGRLTPSFRWIRAAFRLSEDDVLWRHGLDALVVVRLFKFGTKCFTVCSIVGLFILAPTNYSSEGLPRATRSNSMELFTVSNVARGSNRLASLKLPFTLLQELPVAFVSFKSQLDAAQAAEMQQHVNPLSLVTTYAPEPTDAIWSNLAIPFWRIAVYKLGVFIAAFLLIVFFTIPVTAVQGIVQFEKIKKWFPPARAVQLIPGLNSVITGYLPSMVLNGFIYLIPFAMLGMASFEGCIAKSQKEIKACNMVFYFLLGNVFFLSVLSGSLLHQIGESFTHPKDIPSRLARAVSAQSDFFITYILTDGMSGFSLEVLQFGLLTWQFFKAHSIGHNEQPYLMASLTTESCPSFPLQY
ncbi:hypothetical protein E2562_027379 [Oryza meyeriana var. granulata]|uniref:CSC1/OSCA1-like 7TM region domain-containing protein n=1 Tax=Oryza meyeriana var. granulata TaxID=110450 RepID=A0A6G1EQ62_9ORYZ|nr:hypothetical protein E2562_027379 [Oryza meyeriana var. granulata]KAF0926764.1 hypothetical protein E2562_027379 [Oryza meyeriana var. granulata]